MPQHPRRMADQRDGLPGRDGRLDERDRVLVFRKIPERAMAARIEDGIEPIVRDRVEPQRFGQRRLGGLVGLEPPRRLGLRVGLVAFRVERWLAALG